jgi:Flp pilus assembly protein TadG
MNHPSMRKQPATSWIRWRHESGQATVELSMILLVLVILAYGLIDFCTAIYEKQVIVNLTREGANLSARGYGDGSAEIMTNALQAIMQEAAPLNLSTNSSSGLLVLTQAANTNNQASGFYISQQLRSGKLSASSKVGTGVGSYANLPSTIVAQSGHYVYIAEIFYKFNAPAPLQKLIHATVTNQFYDVAYFPGS